MNPFLLSPSEQMREWKSLREEIAQIDDNSALQHVADYWARAPLVRMAYDPENPKEWLSPWEMIQAADWCPFSVAIGMEFTLRLSGWNPSRMRLLLIRDYDISEQRMILKIDDRRVLNYSVGSVTDYPQTRHDVLIVYCSDGKHYFETTK